MDCDELACRHLLSVCLRLGFAARISVVCVDCHSLGLAFDLLAVADFG